MSTRVYLEGDLKSNRAKRIEYVEDGECWICLSHPLSHGIPHIKRGSPKSRPVAEYVYEREVGPKPDGMMLTRSCGDLLCIRPAHVRWKPFPDSRKVKGVRRERIARMSDILGVRETARIARVSERTVVRIRREHDTTNWRRRDERTGKYTHRRKTDDRREGRETG